MLSNGIRISRVRKRSHGSALFQTDRNPFVRFVATYFEKSALLHYPRSDIFKVVSRVDHYQKFIPYCTKSTIFGYRPFDASDSAYQRVDDFHVPDTFEAELQIGFQLFAESFTSKVTIKRNTTTTTSNCTNTTDEQIENVSDVHNTKTETSPWTDTNKNVDIIHSEALRESNLFSQLDSTWKLTDGPYPSSTIVHYSVAFQFSSRVYKHVAEVFLNSVTDEMMNAFQGRCKKLYGTEKKIYNYQDDTNTRSSNIGKSQNHNVAVISPKNEEEMKIETQKDRGDATSSIVAEHVNAKKKLVERLLVKSRSYAKFPPLSRRNVRFTAQHDDVWKKR